MTRTVPVALYRRLSRVHQVLQRTGVMRLAGAAQLAAQLRAVLLPRGEPLVYRVRGVSLHVPDRFVGHYAHREYEPITTAAFLGAVPPRGVVVDVGAHIGYYACLAGRALGPSGVVHAVEPCPDNLEYLRRNIDENRLENVTIHAVAAAATSGHGVLHVTGSSDSHGLHPHPLTATLSTASVRTRSLDDLLAPPVDLVKVDVEGAEIDVLGGMRRLLHGSPGATLIVEWNPACLRAAGRAPEELPQALRAAGVRDLSVLDDRTRRVWRLEEVLPTALDPALPPTWYTNLHGTVG